MIRVRESALLWLRSATPASGVASPGYEQHGDVAKGKHGSDHDSFPETHSWLPIRNVRGYSRNLKTRTISAGRLSRIVAGGGYHLANGVAHHPHFWPAPPRSGHGCR